MSTAPHDAGRDVGSSQVVRSGRVAAAILLAFSAILAVSASQIEYAFSSDPLGPRAFPYLLAAALAICGIWYFLSPGEAEPWPRPDVLRSAVILIAVTTASVALMDHIGFLPAAFIMCACAAYLFGAPPLAAVGVGAAQAVFWFLLFKYALGTYLPSGSWLFPG
jgi:putative tricarboxylic transport membrane protein